MYHQPSAMAYDMTFSLVLQNEDIPRVPVVCTGNDFSTLYAPLIRDGRMEKFYWSPTREDRVGVAMGIFQVMLHIPL